MESNSLVFIPEQSWESTHSEKEMEHIRKLVLQRHKRLFTTKASYAAEQNSKYFGNILIDVCQKTNTSVLKFKNAEEAIMFVRKLGGFEDFYLELSKDKGHEQLIIESNSKKSIYILAQVFMPDQNSTGFDGYKKSVRELRTWIRLVRRLTRSGSKDELKAFSTVVRGSTVWNSERIFMTIFFMAFTGEYKDYYTLEDCLKVIKHMETYENWLDTITTWLSVHWGEEGRDVVEHRSFQSIAHVLSKPENHCIKPFIKKLAILKEDRALLSEFDSVFNSAIYRGKKNKLRKNYDKEKDMKLVSDLIIKQLSNLTIKQTYDFFKRAPYMFSWVDATVIKKAILVNYSILKIAHKYIPEEAEKADIWYHEPKPYGEMLNEILYNKNPFGLGFGFLEANVFQTKKMSERTIDEELEKSFEIMAENLSHDNFIDWLKLLERYDHKIFINLPVELALSLYLYIGKNNTPETLVTELLKEKWFVCITDKLFDYYHLESDRLSEDKKGNLIELLPTTT